MGEYLCEFFFYGFIFSLKNRILPVIQKLGYGSLFPRTLIYKYTILLLRDNINYFLLKILANQKLQL